MFTGASTSGKASVSADASELTISFTCDKDWTVSVPAVDWCVLSATSGKAGTIALKAKILANSGYDERNVSLTISCPVNTKTYVIAQKQRDALLLSSSKVELGEEEESFSIEVSSNVNVDCTIPAQYASWLSKTSSRGLTVSTYTFLAKANDSGDARTGRIRFSGGGLAEEVEVYQTSGSTLLLSEPTLTVGSTGGRVSAQLKSNIEFSYSVTSGSEWIHPVDSRALSTHTVYFDIDRYSDPDNDRTGSVTFRGDGIEATLTIVQRCVSALIIGSGDLSVDYLGGDFEVEYTANCELSIKPDCSWITIGATTPSRAMTAYRTAFTVGPNYTPAERTGHIDLASASDPSVKGRLTVTQSAFGFSVTTTLNEGDFDDARAHDFTITVNTDVEYRFDVSDAMIQDLGDGHFRLKANTTEGKSGYSTVTLRMFGNDSKIFVVNYQEPQPPSLPCAEYEVNPRGAELRIPVFANAEVKYSVSSGSSFLSLKGSEKATVGKAADYYTYTIPENTSGETRTARITFKTPHSESATATITQKPYHEPETVAEVAVDEATSLEEAVGEDIKEVESLTVSGSLDGADIGTMRVMATEGKLVDLDLSASRIVMDNTVYDRYMGMKGTIPADDEVGDLMFRNTKIATLQLPPSVTKIGRYAFHQSAIEEIELPATVTTLSESCFEKCAKLEKINIPDLVEEIPDFALFGTLALREVTVGSGVKKIGSCAFAPYDAYFDHSSQLHRVDLPDGLEEIGFKAFCSTGITEMRVPASVDKVAQYAFYMCRSLNKIVFENSMDTLPPHVLENCASLSQIVFPAGLRVIGANALTAAGIKRLVIPEGVVELGANSLDCCAQYDLRLPESLEIIGPRSLAFRSLCSEFTIPARVRKIGLYAFYGTWSVKRLHVKCPVPPECDGPIFSESVANCVLYVPAGSASRYQGVAPWSSFKEIVEE